MSFKDRLSALVVQEIPNVTHAGRWIVQDGFSGMTVNRVAAELGHALMPKPAGGWEYVGPNGSAAHGHFLSDALPNAQDVEALRQLGQLLRNEGASWLEWSCVSPVAPGLDDAVRSDPFEDEIESQLHHLEAVCRKPRTHIRLDVQRELVGRAKRIARDAPQWLASHTEDWHHRTLTGVQPRRIRAEVREERWDSYENRVAARLVDNLATWLRRRCARVRRILEDILAHTEEFSGTPKGSRHRADRIYRLWGEAWESKDEDAHEVAKTTLARLDALLYRVLGLQDSPLYHHVPERAQVPRTLKMTNLLNTDDHYRGVARLWHAWSLLPTRGSPSIRAHYQQQQELHESYDAWCMLLVVRACHLLRLDNEEVLESVLCKGCSVRLNSGLCLQWEQEGGICISGHDTALVRFVPLIHSLECVRTEHVLRERVLPLVEVVSGTQHWTVILHPANPGPTSFPFIATVGNPPMPGTPGAVDFVRVSPYSLDCVEKVARAIRWATLAPQMLKYPPSVSAPPDDRTKSWLVQKGKGWVMLDLPTSNTANRHIEDCFHHAVSVREDLAHKRTKAKQSHRPNKGLLEEVREAEHEEKRWREFKRNYEEATACIAELKICPRCGEDAEFHVRDENCFSCRCNSESCAARWELRPSPDGHRIPVFLPPDGYVPPLEAPPTLIDEQLGCDLLALPCFVDGSVGFRPPRAIAIDL